MATIYKINENGVLRDMTPEEKAEKQASDNAWQNGGALEQALNNLRRERNGLLKDSDWTDLPNTPLTDEKKSEWQTYRTNLRDITDGLTTVEEVNAVEFPTKPS
jgi:hypothetical protein